MQTSGTEASGESAPKRRSPFDSFLASLAFLTRAPVPSRALFSLEDVARSQVWFSTIGLILGGSLVLVDRVANLGLPDPSVDVIVVVTLVLLTGALHLDGLADAADGLFGGETRERRLDIMHDVHAGTYAIVAIVSVLSLKWAGLIAIPSSVRVETLLLFPCLARFAAVLALGTFPYAREQGIGEAFRDHAWPTGIMISGVVALAAAIILLGAGGIGAFVLAGACGLLLGLLSTRLVGGVTGDTVGGIIEVTEAVLVLGIAFGVERSWIEPWVLA